MRRTLVIGSVLGAACFGQAPLSVRLEAQLGHSELVSASAYSPDGKLAATASSGLVTLWDLETRRQIYQIPGGWREVTALGFPGDDTLLVTSFDPGGSASRFRLETGQAVTSPPALSTCANGAFLQTDEGRGQSAIRETRSSRILVRPPFSPKDHRYGTGHDLACTASGKVAVIAALNGGAWRPEVWDLTTGKRIRTLGASAHDTSIVALSPDGRLAATVEEASIVIHVWDVATGNELRQVSGLRDLTPEELKAANAAMAALVQHLPRIMDVAFSPDGKLVGAGGMGSAMVWEAQTGRQVSQFRQGSARVSTLSFSPDSNRVLLGNSSGVVVVNDVAMRPVPPPTGIVGGLAPSGTTAGRPPAPAAPPIAAPPPMEAVQRAFLNGASNGRVGSLSPDGRYLFLTWNGEDPLLTRGDPLVDGLSISGPVADLLTAVLGPNPYPLVYFDLKTGRTGQWPAVSRVFSSAFTPDGRSVVLGHANGSITVWDLEHRKLVRTIPAASRPNTLPAAATMVATNGTTLLAGYRDGSMRQIPLGGGAAQAIPLPEKTHAEEVLVSPDGSHILLGFSSDIAAGVDMLHSLIQDVTKLPVVGVLMLMNAKGKIAEVPTHFPARGAAAFLPGGKSIAISDGVNISIYDADTGSKLRQLPSSSAVRRLAVSSDGLKLITATFDGQVALREIASGKTLWTAPRRSNGQVVSLRFAGVSRIYAVQSDGTSQFLDALTGKPIVTLIQFSSGKWASSTPDGRFDTADLGDDLPVHWIASDAPLKALPAEMFQRDYYEPRLLSRVLAGEKLPAVRNLAELNRLLPTVTITAVTREGDPGRIRVFNDRNETLTVHVEVTETRDPKTGRSSGAQNLRLFGDGRLVAYAPAEDGLIPLQNGKASFDFQHVRSHGVFSVHAFNSDGVKTPTHGYSYSFDKGWADAPGRTGRERSAAGFQIQPLPNGRRASIIAIGVDQNALPTLNLQYSANDAKRLSSDLSARLEASRQFEKVATTALISDAQHPDGANKESIRQSIVSLAGTGPTAAGPNDLVIVSFSGHGYAGEDGKFYLVPSDGGKGISPANISRERLLAQSISSDDLARWLRDIDAGRMVLIIDACQSAAVLGGDGFKPGPMGSRGLGQLAYDKGITILAATQADNVALESGKVGHGLLTYALTQEGLENMAADWQPKDGRIEVREWLRYAENRVPDLWAAIQAGEISRDLVLETGSPAQARTWIRQEPALFDFSLADPDPLLVDVKKVSSPASPSTSFSPPPPPPPPPPKILAPAPGASQVAEVSGTAMEGLLVKKVAPVYPAVAKTAGIQGVVRLQVTVGKDGSVQNIVVLSGPPLLVEAAKDAVGQWVYKPYLLNGQPTSVRAVVTLSFVRQ